MFGWFKRRLRREHARLIWQTGTAASRMGATFRVEGDFESEEICGELCREVLELSETAVEGILSHQSVERLLEINKNLRRTFDHIEATGSKAQVYLAMGHEPEKRDFDKVFQPMLGWDKFYESEAL